MSHSIVSICNAGLISLGEDTITSLTDDTKAARLCNQRHEAIRDAVLREAKWNFAIERVQLALLTTSPEFGFSNQFQLPTDYLKLLKTDDELDTYKIEGGKLLTNRGSVKIQYVKLVADVAQYDSLFAEAYSAAIAVELALPLTDSDSRLASMVELYDRKIAAAKGSDAQENGSIEVYEADEWVNSRRGTVAT